MTKHGPGGVGKLGHLGQSDLVTLLAAAIKRMEGWVPGSVSYRNNNPGNLRPLPGGWPGQVGVDSGGYAVFDSVASGEAALDRQIQLNINRGLTLEEFFAGKPGVYAGFAPAADRNQPNVYAANVASWPGIDPSVPLASLVGSGAADTYQAGGQASDTGETPPSDESPGDELNPVIVGLVAAGAALLWAALHKG